jgi:hypothetical protein
MTKAMRGTLALLFITGASGAFAFAAAPAPGAKPASAPAAAKPAPPDDSTVEGRQYVYDPAGRRDPFKSLLIRERSRESRPPGIPGLSVDEMELQGIWKTRSGWLAQVRGSDNKSYLLRKGDVLFDGEVIDVKANELTLRQNVNDPQSVKPFRDVVKRLNAPRPE